MLLSDFADPEQISVKNYIKELWKTYNIMLENPLDKETIEYLN